MNDPEGLTKAEYVEQIEATRGGRKRIHEPGCGVKASEPCTCSLPLATCICASADEVQRLREQNDGLYAAVRLGAEEQARLRSLIAELIETPLSDTIERARAALAERAEGGQAT